MAIDVIDEKLLSVLQENARISISELSKRINLSLSAVSERLKKLEASGVIQQYTAILDPKQMQKNIAAIILLTINGDPRSADFIKYIQNNKDILSCSRTTGQSDYILKIWAKDTSALQTYIDELKALRGVTNVHSLVLLDDIKINYSVAPVATK